MDGSKPASLLRGELISFNGVTEEGLEHLPAEDIEVIKLARSFIALATKENIAAVEADLKKEREYWAARMEKTPSGVSVFKGLRSY